MLGKKAGRQAQNLRCSLGHAAYVLMRACIQQVCRDYKADKITFEKLTLNLLELTRDIRPFCSVLCHVKLEISYLKYSIEVRR